MGIITHFCTQSIGNCVKHNLSSSKGHSFMHVLLLPNTFLMLFLLLDYVVFCTIDLTLSSICGIFSLFNDID